MHRLLLFCLLALGAIAGPITCSPECVGNLAVSASLHSPGEATYTVSYDGFVLIDSGSGTLFADYAIGGSEFTQILNASGWACPSISIGTGSSLFSLQTTNSSPAPGQCFASEGVHIGSPISQPFTYTAGIPVEISASASISLGPLPDSLFIGNNELAEGNAFVTLEGFTDANGSPLGFQVLPEPAMWPALTVAFSLLALWSRRIRINCAHRGR